MEANLDIGSLEEADLLGNVDLQVDLHRALFVAWLELRCVSEAAQGVAAVTAELRSPGRLEVEASPFLSMCLFDAW